MTEPRIRQVRIALRPFDRLNLLSVALTAVIALLVLAMAEPMDVSSQVLTRHVLIQMGLVHINLGHQFFFGSSSFRGEVVTYSVRSIARVFGTLVASLCICLWPEHEVVVGVIFYIHAVENLLFLRSRYATSSGPQSSLSVQAIRSIVPWAVLLGLFARYLDPLPMHVRIIEIGIVLWHVLFFRLGAPLARLRTIATFARQEPLLAAYIVVIGVLIPRGGALYDLTVIGHYNLWLIYTFMERGEQRAKLARSYFAWSALFLGLFLLLRSYSATYPPALLVFLVGQRGFFAQTLWHFNLSTVFRARLAARTA